MNVLQLNVKNNRNVGYLNNLMDSCACWDFVTLQSLHSRKMNLYSNATICHCLIYRELHFLIPARKYITRKFFTILGPVDFVKKNIISLLRLMNGDYGVIKAYFQLFFTRVRQIFARKMLFHKLPGC